MNAPPKPARTTSGRIYLTYLGCIERAGLKEAVLADVSPAAAAFARAPHLVTDQLDSRMTDEILVGYQKHRGARAVWNLGFEATRDVFVPLLKPLIESQFVIHGKSPQTVLSRLPKLAGQLVTGTEFAWTPRDAQSGTIDIRFDVAPPPIVFTLWEGVLVALCLLAETRVTAAPTVFRDGGRAGTIRLEWSRGD